MSYEYTISQLQELADTLETMKLPDGKEKLKEVKRAISILEELS